MELTGCCIGPFNYSKIKFFFKWSTKIVNLVKNLEIEYKVLLIISFSMMEKVEVNLQKIFCGILAFCMVHLIKITINNLHNLNICSLFKTKTQKYGS